MLLNLLIYESYKREISLFLHLALFGNTGLPFLIKYRAFKGAKISGWSQLTHEPRSNYEVHKIETPLG